MCPKQKCIPETNSEFTPEKWMVGIGYFFVSTELGVSKLWPTGLLSSPVSFWAVLWDTLKGEGDRWNLSMFTGPYKDLVATWNMWFSRPGGWFGCRFGGWLKFTIEWKTLKNTSKNVVNVEICRNPKVGRFAWLRSKVGRWFIEARFFFSASWTPQRACIFFCGFSPFGIFSCSKGSWSNSMMMGQQLHDIFWWFGHVSSKWKAVTAWGIYTYSQYSADSNNFQEVKCPEVSFFALCRERNLHLKSCCEFSKGWSLFEILGLLVNTSNHLIRIEPFSNIGNVLDWIYDGFTWYPYSC